MEKILTYSKVLKPYPRELRKQMTDCERLLWSKIRRKQILRFTNLEILQETHAVLSKIDGAISWLTSPRCPLAIARRHRPPMKGVFDNF